MHFILSVVQKKKTKKCDISYRHRTDRSGHSHRVFQTDRRSKVCPMNPYIVSLKNI